MGFWTDLWSFLTAIGTISMAMATYSIIRQSKRQREDAEGQHRDRFRPVCVLTPNDGVDPLNRRGEFLEKIEPSPENPAFGTLAIKCTLRNVGTGPALNVQVKLKSSMRAGWESEPWELAPLEAGESRGSKGTDLLIPIRIDERFNVSDLSAFPGEGWEIWLEYQDVFGQRFRAVHHKSPIRQEEALIPDPQAPGKVRCTPQPWVTFPESGDNNRWDRRGRPARAPGKCPHIVAYSLTCGRSGCD